MSHRHTDRIRTLELWLLIAIISILLILPGSVAAVEDETSYTKLVKISDGGFENPQNNYAWSVAEFNGDLYVGTGRNIPYFAVLAMQSTGVFSENWSFSFLTSPGGSPPPPFVLPNHTFPSQEDVITWSDDMSGEIWRYHEGFWTRVHKAPTFVNPLNGYTYPEGIGYRAMTTFNDTGGTDALYAGVGLGMGRTLIIRSTDGTTWERVNTNSIPGKDTRALLVHNGKLYVGTADGLYTTESPSATQDTWVKVADFQVASLATYNGYLYAGTGNSSGKSTTNGFEVWRSTTPDPAGPDDWVRVVSGGAGDAWNVLAATMMEHEGDLFVGSMNLPFMTGTEGVKGFDLVRVNSNDTWDLVIGNYEPKIPTDPRGPPLSGWPSGYANPFNLYAWSFGEYHGDMYLGTFDIFSLARYIGEVPGGYDILIEAIASRENGGDSMSPEETGALFNGLSEIGMMGEADGNGSYIIPMIELLAANFGGADLWKSTDGVHWTPVDLNGFGNANNYGFRTLHTTPGGLVIGTANPYTGCQVWVLSTEEESPPAGVSGLHSTGTEPDSITWEWTDPATDDLSHVLVFLDGVFQQIVGKGTERYTATGLSSGTAYTVGTKTVGENGMINQTMVTDTAWTEFVPPVSGFAAVPRTGNAPLSVSFLDQSSGSLPLTYSWDFGDGTSSTDKNPVHEYGSAGSYNVTLTVTNIDGESTVCKNNFVVVLEVAPLRADFTSNVTSGTLPLPVRFSDASAGSPSSWAWVFQKDPLYPVGDAGTQQAIPYLGNEFSNEKNPIVTYTYPGNYSVTLTVSRTNETDTITKEDFIHVDPPAPEANFAGYPTEGNAPLEVEFWENVPFSWYYDEFLWDFGDGTNGTGTWLYHTYENPGLYDVTLTVTSRYGSDTATRTAFINVTQNLPPDPGFEGTPLSGSAPLGVTFSDVSTGIVTSRYWDFGDGASAWENGTASISHTYLYPGTFTVSLTAGNDAGQATATRTEYISVNPSGAPPDARFTLKPAIGNKPLAVQFTDRSTGMPVRWLWDFGDGATSSEQSPLHTYTTSGRFVPTLTVWNSGGSDSSSSHVWVRSMKIVFPTYTPSPTATPLPTVPPRPGSSPISFFMMNQTFSSAPMTVLFTDRSINSPTGWLWDFGDGHTSTLQNPVNTFIEPGTYSVSLTVSNPSGESTMSRRVYVH